MDLATESLDCLQRDRRDDPAAGSPESESDVVERDERPVRCRACGHPVTVAGAAEEISGHVDHSFFNPAGVLFEIRCFGEAEGCGVHGEPTTEFTWFPGHAWSYASCVSCMVHLGWYFQGRSSFFGLIRRNLIEP